MLCADKKEKGNHYAAMQRAPGTTARKKSPTAKGGTLPLLLPKKILVWVYSRYKQWEGRSVRSCMRLMGRLPEVGDRVSMCAGSGRHGIVYCSIEEVRVVKKAKEVVNRDNWRLFVPWVKNASEALDVYDAFDDDKSGLVFMKLSSIERSENIGCK
jgi:hypothetical protein